MNFIMFPNLLGGGLTDFGADPDGVESAWHIFVCTISCEPVVGFLQIFMDT